MQKHALTLRAAQKSVSRGLYLLWAVLGLCLLVPKVGIADALAASNLRYPLECGSVCIGPFNIFDNGTVNGSLVTTLSYLSDLERSQAYVDTATGSMGALIEIGHSSAFAQASHSDTWFC